MTDPQPLIVMVGALNADLGIRVARLPQAGETVSGHSFEISPGGKASNQSVAAARLGGHVRLIGAVGGDGTGELLLSRAADAGVDVSFVATLPDAPTGQAIIPVDDDGENSIILIPGANGAFAPELLREAAFTGAAAVCLSLEIPLTAIVRAAELAADAGAAVVLNPSPYRTLPAALLAATEVLIVNELEAGQLVGSALDFTGEGRDAALAALRSALEPHGITRVVVTRGADGALVLDGAVIAEVPARRVDAVDTTGCGDAFAGTLARRLAAGDTLAEAAAEASVVAAFAATRRGAQGSYPTAPELAAWR